MIDQGIVTGSNQWRIKSIDLSWGAGFCCVRNTIISFFLFTRTELSFRIDHRFLWIKALTLTLYLIGIIAPVHRWIRWALYPLRWLVQTPPVYGYSFGPKVLIIQTSRPPAVAQAKVYSFKVQSSTLFFMGMPTNLDTPNPPTEDKNQR